MQIRWKGQGPRCRPQRNWSSPERRTVGEQNVLSLRHLTVHKPSADDLIDPIFLSIKSILLYRQLYQFSEHTSLIANKFLAQCIFSHVSVPVDYQPTRGNVWCLLLQPALSCSLIMLVIKLHHNYAICSSVFFRFFKFKNQ